MSNKIKSKKNILSKLNIDEKDLILTSSETKDGINNVLNLIEEIVG